MDLINFITEDLLRAFAFVGLYCILFLCAKWMKDFLVSYSINDELVLQDNTATAITMCGYYLGVLAIFVGAMVGPSYGFLEDLMLVGGYSVLGLVLLNTSRFFNDRFILYKFSNSEQIINQKNIAVGAVQCGTYIATGLIAAGAITGVGGGVLTTIVFFVLGQISLLLFTFIYDFVTPYAIHDELLKKNQAVGLALGGTLIALGIIIFNGVAGDFISWQANGINLLIVNTTAFAFLPCVRFCFDKLIIPGDNLTREIIEDQNLGAGMLEAVVAISFALVLTLVL